MKNFRFPKAVLSLCVVAISSASWAQETPIFEEVLVTAEKRTESLQNLSQAVTALSAEDVENRQLSSFVDLSAIAPGVNVAKNEGFKTVITIRGIGNEANQNAMDNDYNYISNDTSVFARAEYSTTHCYVIYPFQLVVNPNPIATSPLPLTLI